MASTPHPVEGPPAPRRRSLRMPPPRKLAALLGVWAAVVVVALLVANQLDQPVGSGALDPSQPIIAGPVVSPGPGPGQAAGRQPEGLPPLALVLDAPFPREVANLPLAQQIAALERQAQTSETPVAWTRLGVALQSDGAGAAADAAFRQALALAPEHLPARLGVLMVQAAASPEGLAQTRLALDDLADQRPRDQLIAFNQGWLAVYARDGSAAVAAWTRTAGIDRGSFLGDAAARLIARISAGATP